MSAQLEPWATYGLHESAVREFVTEYSGASLAITSLEITAGGLLRHERSITDNDTLWNFLTVVPIPPSTSLRILAVKELSGEGLQILSTALGIHLGFWAWVVSDDASDGFWLNTHNDGKILSFDLPCLEFYATSTVPTTGVVREGRLKHLSSLHRLFGTGLDQGAGKVSESTSYCLTPNLILLSKAESYEIYLNRRVSSYLIPHGNSHTFVYFSEDCRAVSSIQLGEHPRTGPISTQWFISMLKSSERATRKKWTQEPVGLILKCVQRLLKSWHVFTVQTQRDLERIDSSLPESLPTQLPVHNLYDVGAYLHRDIVQTLHRFTLQLGKYDGYLNYLCNGTLDHFRPKLFLPEVGNLKNNVLDLRRRLDGCRDRGNGSLALINNYISLQQARLAHEQATISARVAVIQQRDSQSSTRLSIVATVFLPLSFAASWLSTNSTTPLWVFFVIAILSMFGTTFVVLFMKWMEKGWLKRFTRRAWREVFKNGGVKSNAKLDDKMTLNSNPSLFV